MDMSENFWLGVWHTVGVTVIAVALIIGGCTAYNSHLFVKGGYYSCVLPGKADAQWCK